VTVAQHEVDDLRRAGEGRGLDGIENVFDTTAECLGHMIAEMRIMGWTEQEMLDAVETVTRAVGVDATALRTARDTLRLLNYQPSLIKLLTALARRARH